MFCICLFSRKSYFYQIEVIGVPRKATGQLPPRQQSLPDWSVSAGDTASVPLLATWSSLAVSAHRLIPPPTQCQLLSWDTTRSWGGKSLAISWDNSWGLSSCTHYPHRHSALQVSPEHPKSVMPKEGIMGTLPPKWYNRRLISRHSAWGSQGVYTGKLITVWGTPCQLSHPH